MPNISGKDITLWKAAARFKNLVYIAATMDDLVEQEVPHSTFVSMMVQGHDPAGAGVLIGGNPAGAGLLR